MTSVEHRFWTFEESPSSSLPYSLWQPDHFILKTGIRQPAKGPLPSWGHIFDAKSDWSQPLQTISHSVEGTDELGFWGLEPERELARTNPVTKAYFKRIGLPVDTPPTTLYRELRWTQYAPICGKHHLHTNGPIPYDPVPSDLEAVRETLFRLRKRVLLYRKQISDYWPHMSNVWRPDARRPPVRNANGTWTQYWKCHATIDGHKSTRPIPKTSRRLRKTDEMLKCDAQMQTVTYTHHKCPEAHKTPLWQQTYSECKCIPEWMHLISRGKHTHSLNDMDDFRRSHGLLLYCRWKLESRQWTFSQVLRWMRDQHGEDSSQFRNLTRGDISNAVRSWRSANMHITLTDENEERQADTADMLAYEKRQEVMTKVVNIDTADALKLVVDELLLRLPAAAGVIGQILRDRGKAFHTTNEIVVADHGGEGSFPRGDAPATPEVIVVDDRPSLIEGDQIMVPAPGLPAAERREPSSYKSSVAAVRAGAGNVVPLVAPTAPQAGPQMDVPVIHAAEVAPSGMSTFKSGGHMVDLNATSGPLRGKGESLHRGYASAPPTVAHSWPQHVQPGMVPAAPRNPSNALAAQYQSPHPTHDPTKPLLAWTAPPQHNPSRYPVSSSSHFMATPHHYGLPMQWIPQPQTSFAGPVAAASHPPTERPSWAQPP